jgi:hypothetical protein
MYNLVKSIHVQNIKFLSISANPINFANEHIQENTVEKIKYIPYYKIIILNSCKNICQI